MDADQLLLYARYSEYYGTALAYLGLLEDDLSTKHVENDNELIRRRLEAASWYLRLRRVYQVAQLVEQLELRDKHLERASAAEGQANYIAEKVILCYSRHVKRAPNTDDVIRDRDLRAEMRYQLLRAKVIEREKRSSQQQAKVSADSYEKTYLLQMAAYTKKEQIEREIKQTLEQTARSYWEQQSKVSAIREQYKLYNELILRSKAEYMDAKLEHMRLRKKELDENRRYKNNFSRMYQDYMMEKVLYRIEQEYLVKQAQTREFYYARNAKIDEYFNRYYYQLHEKDRLQQLQSEKHYAQRYDVLAEKSQKVHQQLVAYICRHRYLWYEIRAQNASIAEEAISYQYYNISKAEERRKEILGESQLKMKEKAFRAWCGSLKGAMMQSYERYRGTLHNTYLQQKTKRMLELKADSKYQDDVMRRYTVVYYRGYQEKQYKAFSLEYFLNFDHLEKGYIRGYYLKTMYDMALFMETAREKERYELLSKAENYSKKTALRQEFCKERRESDKIVRILEGMWREVDYGVIV